MEINAHSYPQLALDMIFDNHESGGSAQKETSRPEFCLRLLERSEIQPLMYRIVKKKKMSRLRLDLGMEMAVLRTIGLQIVQPRASNRSFKKGFFNSRRRGQGKPKAWREGRERPVHLRQAVGF